METHIVAKTEPPSKPSSPQPIVINTSDQTGRQVAESRDDRQKRLMALGDRVKRNPSDAQAIQELVAFLADRESSLRWLAG